MRVFSRGLLALAIWIVSTGSGLAQGPAPDSPPLPASSPISQGDSNLYLPLVALTYPDPLGELADAWYLMVDDGHIQARDVQRIYHPFKKYAGNPILRADKAWEGKVIQLYGTVLPGYRMWYSSYNHEQDKGQVLYAESRDGLARSKPNLDGSGHNVLFSGQNANLASVLHTPHDLSMPYKLFVYQGGVFNGYSSLDGTHTTPLAANPVFSNGGDIAHFYWDPNLQRYRAAVKERGSVLDVQRRVLRLIDSQDLTAWVSQPDLLTPDINDERIFPGFYPNFYGMPAFPNGEQYVGLLWILKARDKAGLRGPTLVQMASSHDGTHWIRQEGNRIPMLDLGPAGAWDDGQVYTASKPIRVGDQFWLYYSGCNQEHGVNLANTVCSIGLAKAGFNRLASLTGSGTILTESLEPGGEVLRLNLDASLGEVRVELQANGVAIPGYEAENCLPLTQDSQEQPVAWLAQSKLPEEPFQIKFILQDSSLYAFGMFED